MLVFKVCSIYALIVVVFFFTEYSMQYKWQILCLEYLSSA